MEPITLRSALESDAPSLAELNGQLGYSASPDVVRERLIRILRSKEDCLRVAILSDGRIAGWIHAQLCQWLESDYRAEIGGLVVDASQRRRGVGARLVAAVAEWARSRGAVELSVRCQIHRTEAHAFYVAQGFHLTKSQHVFRRTLNEGAT
ncbi:MAG: GNAT family N-acetyltransferase [Verrucomicrobiota bacterium]